MANDARHPAMGRLLRDRDVELALDVLSERLSGADLTTLLLEVARRRSGRVSASDVLKQYRRDRFAAVASVEALRMRAVEDRAVEGSSGSFEIVTLAPVVPFGTHSAFAGVSQNNVVTTTRGTEVAADPTNALALEAAVRRRRLLDDDPRSAKPVHLAALQRVVRAQQLEGALSFAHFSLLGAVTAGRDVGDHAFEIAAVVQHVQMLAATTISIGADEVSVKLTDFDGRRGAVIEQIIQRLERMGVDSVQWPDRDGGRGYYVDICFKLYARFGDDEIEVGDGGLVSWTQGLLQNRKERLMISGLGLDRLALVGP
jgi:hypothetical protein